ncbi:MAG: B12-binding domain-containing radical SAM protein [Candidatus Scalindua sp.]
MSIILLEHPRPRTPDRCESVVNTPLSSCLMTGYVMSTLRSNNHSVDIVDANLYGWTFDKTIQELKKKSFKLLGVHLVYLWENTDDVFEMLLHLRKSTPDAHINLYGHLPTFAPRELLANYSFVDSVTIGEPEITFLELSNTIINNKDTSTLYTINGLAFNCTDSELEEGILKPDVVLNKPRKPVSNLDILPFPYRNDLELTKKKGISTYILASRGCYGKCTFCYLDNFYGGESSWRGRSPENVFKEICDIYEEFEERYFYFADANFLGPGKKGKERVYELASLIIDRGLNIKFGIECRVNDIENKTIGILVRAGLKDVFLGVESGNQRSLNKFRKFTKVEDNKNAIIMLRKYGVEPNYGFIMFEPDSTIPDLRENFEFLKEAKMLNSPAITAHLLHHKQTIFKGTLDYEKRNNGTKPFSKLGYERAYEFKDKAVDTFSEEINAFCLQVLKELDTNRGFNDKERDSCVHGENNSYSRQMNDKLIEHFEKSLSSFE